MPRTTNLQKIVSTRPQYGFDGDDPVWAIAATQPRNHPTTAPIDMEQELSSKDPTVFLPTLPKTLPDAGLTECQVEALVTKFLLNTGASTGRQIAAQTALPFTIIERLLQSMKLDQLIGIKSDSYFGDYSYELTESGIERARLYSRQTSYFGAAPVPLSDYVDSVELQSIRAQKISLDKVEEAFADLVVSLKLMRHLGEAMYMGRGMFLHGAPGNGKSSIAQALIRAYGRTLWIPRAIIVGGEIVRLYDPIHHVETPLDDSDPNRELVDNRWVRIERPAISVSGELSLQSLDITSNATTGINEAPLQMKCNCGILTFDDFGRNRFAPEQLLNRLIVPLERQSDALAVSSGRTFQVPFDCMVVFATNLDPLEMINEAFLRRIPFSFAIQDPLEEEYREVFRKVAKSIDVKYEEDQLNYLIQNHYRDNGRPMRFCHPHDILHQIKNACDFQNEPTVATNDRIDTAIENLLSLRP